MSGSYISMGYDFDNSPWDTTEFKLTPLNGAFIQYRKHHWSGTVDSWTTLSGTTYFQFADPNKPHHTGFNCTHIDIKGIGNSNKTGPFLATSYDYGYIAISGDLESLIEGEGSSVTDFNLPNRAFYQMFKTVNGNVTNIKNLVFPNKPMSTECCYQMFANNSQLKTDNISILSNALAPSCYKEMFLGCSQMTVVPGLPKTVLADNCYEGMFQNCSSLVNSPSLPKNTDLVNSCYKNMFKGCTKLKSLPFNRLRSTSMQASCCEGMFYGCTSLNELPQLPTINLANRCYYQMFYGCTGIALSSAKTFEYATPYRIPSGTATGIAGTNSLTDMFGNTGGPFTGTPSINTIYYLPGGGTISCPIYVGVNDKAREITNLYVGVNGKARKVTAIYVGVNGKARQIFKD